MPELLYAKNREGRLVHVDSVQNGLSCGCTCPCCGEMLVAKNNGETMQSHFAHYYGTECREAHETMLHLMAKDIIAEERKVMLPPYGNVFKGGQQQFDRVEVEQDDDELSLRPDLCAVAYGKNGKESNLWIEIKVTHSIGPEKRNLIRRNNVSCIEINLARFINTEVTRDVLRHFLLEEAECHEWTNNPVLEEKQRTVASMKRETARQLSERYIQNAGQQTDYETSLRLQNKEKEYLDNHPAEWIQPSHKCMTCKHHTTRLAIFDEIKRRHFPSWLREALVCNLRWLDKDNITSVVSFDRFCSIRYEGYLHLLPTSSPDIHGKEVTPREIKQNKEIIPFLLDVVPDIISSYTFRCGHNKCSFPVSETKYNIACDCPSVVNKHRKNKR